MLNKDGIRMLSYIVQVDDIRPIEGADSVEIAVVGGWTIMVKKEQFQKGDWAIYFEIDSKFVSNNSPYAPSFSLSELLSSLYTVIGIELSRISGRPKKLMLS